MCKENKEVKLNAEEKMNEVLDQELEQVSGGTDEAASTEKPAMKSKGGVIQIA